MSWLVPGILLVLLRVKFLLVLLLRLWLLLVTQRQWLRFALTIGWFAGIFESFRILDAAASGSFGQTIIVMAAWVGWIFGGLWMNRSALREINGLPPREAGKGDDDHA